MSSRRQGYDSLGLSIVDCGRVGITRPRDIFHRGSHHAQVRRGSRGINGRGEVGQVEGCRVTREGGFQGCHQRSGGDGRGEPTTGFDLDEVEVRHAVEVVAFTVVADTCPEKE